MGIEAKDIHVRGTPVIGLMKFLSKELSPEQKVSVIRGLPAPYNEKLLAHVMPSDTLPLSIVNELTERAARERGEDVEAFAFRAGTFGARIGIATAFKPFFMVVSTERALKIAPLMWTRVYDAGRMSIEILPNGARIHISDFSANIAGCGRISGWFTYIGELTGAKDLRVLHEPCMARGGDECVWKFLWR